MEPIDTYGGEEGNAADDIVLLSHPNPTTPLHHVTLTAKPHAFAGAVLTPKHARELTPALVLSVVVSLTELASSTKGGSGGGGAHGSASVTGSISGASAPAAGAHHGHTPSGASPRLPRRRRCRTARPTSGGGRAAARTSAPTRPVRLPGWPMPTRRSGPSSRRTARTADSAAGAVVPAAA